MDDFATRVLQALVEGFEARAGLKERNRALSEYEIARRIGYTSYSYVEFSTSMERDQVRVALDDLERRGWVAQWQRAGRYDTYVPTEPGMRQASTTVGAGPSAAVSTSPVDSALPARGSAPTPAAGPADGAGPFRLEPADALARVVQQLDEALALLRSIDAKLGRDR